MVSSLPLFANIMSASCSFKIEGWGNANKQSLIFQNMDSNRTVNEWLYLSNYSSPSSTKIIVRQQKGAYSGVDITGLPVSVSVNYVAGGRYIESISMNNDSLEVLSQQFPDGLGANGMFFLGGATVDSVGRYFRGRIYNLRLYSRAITAAELAANYAVDKARFNLQ